ncbi:RNA-binding domain-containing protein [Xylaria scruposa]|nr:RNA-binding domain-containing protein [Xylaria scruposa]
MHCIRRAALRAASASSRFVAVPRQHVAANVMQISKANVRPTAVLPLSRYFSQTVPAAQEDKAAADAVESAIKAAEQSGSTADDNPTLQSSLTENELALKQGYTVFISNMTFDATDVHLQEAFSKYGTITKVNIARDGRGLSRGFGFVTYTEKESADRAIREAGNSFWHGRRITVDHRKEGPSGVARRTQRAITGPTNSLYIGNIPYEASDADLNQLFRSLDGVRDVRVAVDRNTGWPRGFAHCDFHNTEDAQKAHEVLSQSAISGRQLRVDYAENRKYGGQAQ